MKPLWHATCEPGPVRVLVVDGGADDPQVLLRAIGEHRPDVVVLDAAYLDGLLAQLAELGRRLDERKLVERAKGILMKAKGLDEESAYRALRQMAMDRSRRIGEVARSVIDLGELLR